MEGVKSKKNKSKVGEIARNAREVIKSPVWSGAIAIALLNVVGMPWEISTRIDLCQSRINSGESIFLNSGPYIGASLLFLAGLHLGYHMFKANKNHEPVKILGGYSAGVLATEFGFMAITNINTKSPQELLAYTMASVTMLSLASWSQNPHKKKK